MTAKSNIQFVLFLATILWGQCLCAEEVGQVQYTRGAVTMQNMDGSSARLVARNEAVQRGQVIKTGPKSFTIVKLNDGTRMTIRPNSSFAVEEFNAKQDSTASALLRLFRGGLRTITGYISKKNPSGYKVKTSVATLGIRGTEFDVRLCKHDCEQENNMHKQAYDKELKRTVARAVFIRGEMVAESIDGESRVLNAGSAIFEGDTLITKNSSYAILVFRDKSRISLQANTVFRVDEMKFTESSAEKSSSLFSLLRGGLRAVTGLLGKLHPNKYKMRTSVATIGIRGTGYDLMCTGECIATGTGSDTTTEKLLDGEGLYAYVWDGSIDFGEQLLSEGAAAYKINQATKVKLLPDVPAFFKENKVPKPNTFKVDETRLFSQIKTEEAPPGLYVSVAKGNVIVKNKSGLTLDLKDGMAGYADVLGRQATQLEKPPAFQEFDVYPMPDVPNPEVVNLNAKSIGGAKSGLTCEIK